MAGNNFDIKDLFGTDGTKKITSDLDLVIKKLDDFQKKVVEAGTAINKQLAERILTMSKLNFGNVKDLERFLKASKEQVSDLQTKNELSKQEQKLAQEKIKTEKLKLQLETQLKRAKEQTEKAEKKKTEAEKKSLDIYQKRRKANTELLNQLRALEAAGKGQSKMFEQLKKGALEERAALDKLDESYGRHFHNVGNYKQSVKEALSELNLFEGSLNKIVGAIKNYTSGIKAAEGATGKFNAVVKGGIILLVIAAVAAFKELIDKIKETQVGLEKFNRLEFYKKATIAAGLTGNSVKFLMEQYDEMIISIKEVNRMMNLNNIELNKLSYTTKDLADDVADGTLAVSARIEAQRELTKAEKEALRLNYENKNIEAFIALERINNAARLQGAKKKYTLEDFEDMKMLGELRKFVLSDEIKNFRTLLLERKKFSLEWADVLGDEMKLIREELEKQLALDLDYINNKKLRAIDETKILQKKISDDKVLISEKEKTNAKLKELENKRINETLETIDLERRTRIANTEADKLGTQSLAALNIESLKTIDDSKELNTYLNSLNITELERSSIINALKKHYEDLNTFTENENKILEEKENVLKRIAGYQNEIAKIERENNLQNYSQQAGKEKTILGYKQEIAQLSRTQLIEDLENQKTETQNFLSELETKIKGDKVFNQKLIAQAKAANEKLNELNLKIKIARENDLEIQNQNEKQRIETEIENSQKILTLKAKDVEAKYLLDKKEAENTIVEKNELNEKLKLLEKQHQIDVENINAEQVNNAEILKAELEKINAETNAAKLANDKEYSESKKQIEKDFNAELKRIRLEQIEEIAHETNTLLNYTGQAQQKRFDKINSDINSQIEKNSEALAAQRERAAQGQANDVATYEENAEKLALAQQREAKRQEKMQEYLAFIKLFSGYAESDPEHALQKTLKDIALMQVAKIAYLNEGTDFVNADNKTIKAGKPFAKGKDIIPAMLARGEAVITNAANAEYKGVSEAMNNFRFDEFVRENYLPKMLLAPKQSFSNNVYESAQLNELIKLNSRIENLENAIIKKRENIFNLDNLGNMVTTTVENGMKHTVKFIQQKPRLK